MKKKLLVCISVLLLAAMMTPGVSSAADPIKIGMVMTLTGSGAQTGIDNKNGIILAAKQKGTILGRPIDLIIEDDEMKPETGIRKAEKLVFKDKAVALIGVAYSNVGLALAGEMDRLNVPFLTTNVMSTKFYGLHPLVFRCGQVADDQAALAYVKGILKFPDLAKRKYYILANDFAWGHACAEEFSKLAAQQGVKVVNPAPGYDQAAINVTDWSPFVSKIAAADVDGMYSCLVSPAVPRFADQAHKFGLMNKIRIVGSSASEETLEAGGESQIGLIGVCSWTWDMDTPESHAFAKAYWEEFKLIPASQGAQAYTGAMVLFNAIEKAGSTDPQKIAAALKGASYKGPYGEVRISPKDNCGRTSAILVEVKPAPQNPYGAKLVKEVIVSLTAEELGPPE